MMEKEKLPISEFGDETAAVCGLYCRACSLFIATREDPVRLKFLAERFGLTEEEIKCSGCRSKKRGPYCTVCFMKPCAADRGIDFCVECTEYPCFELERFQRERPHRADLWEDLEQIGALGAERWQEWVREKYLCPTCGTINSAYDLKCRKCGENPSCSFMARHRPEIESALKGR